MILGTSCDHVTVIATTDLDWYTPPTLSPDGKQWFADPSKPVHPDVIKMLNVVLKNNKKYYNIRNNEGN
jgi:hypothetical protein